MQDIIQKIVTFISKNLYLIVGVVLVVLIVLKVSKKSPKPAVVQTKPTEATAMPVVEEQLNAEKPEEVVVVTDEDLVAPSPAPVPGFITPTDTGEYATAGEMEEALELIGTVPGTSSGPATL